MTRKERYDFVLGYFRKNVGHVTTELNFGSAFQLLCATLLSAQCTDKRINAITPELFRHYPDAKAMAKATVEDVFEYVKSVSYPNAKATHLVEMSKMLVEKFAGEVPSDPDELTQLPGVGRKRRMLYRLFGLETDIGSRYACISGQSPTGFSPIYGEQSALRLRII